MADKALKFVWAYLIENGKITTGEFSYYGRHWESPHGFDYVKDEQDKQVMLKEIKAFGIDWNKTKAPTSSQQSVFDGTFADSSESEALLGTLVLKNGKKFILGCKDVELRFSRYAKVLADLMEDEQRVFDVLGEKL